MENFGTIRISESAEILFYVDSFKGKQYANIRKFVRSRKYTGPTKSGVKLSKEELQAISDSLQNLSAEIQDVEESVLCESHKYIGKFIRVSIHYFNGTFGIDIREFFDTTKYKGPSKAGVRIPYSYLEDTRSCLKYMIAKLGDGPADSLFYSGQKKPEEVQGNQKLDNTEGVPDEYGRFF